MNAGVANAAHVASTARAEALAPYACRPELTRGRRIPEPPAPTRDDFQRDRDRVVHSTAFRRLVYKTQVFLNHEGDLFRTRLTHSLEVAQIARSIARNLRLNEDLIEAISLAHDVGHTPFGHAGQDALNECLCGADPASSGFEHNLQSLRVVDRLEERYPAFDGLNLCFETREGILKHCSLRNAASLEAAEPGGVGRRFIARTQPGLEAQLCNLADEIAYNAHDIDDGVRSGLLTLEQVCAVPLVERFRAEVLAAFSTLTGRRLLFETIRRMLSAQIYDVTDHSTVLIGQHRPESADAARLLPPLIAFGPAMQQRHAELKRFLRESLYRHPQVVATTNQARRVIATLFDAYVNSPDRLPAAQRRDGSTPLRQVADYIAGMTDRYALREHFRITGQRVFE